MAKVKQEFSGSFEMINNDIEQDFSASNGSGNNQQISVCFLLQFFFLLILFIFIFILFIFSARNLEPEIRHD